ncbi:MAG: PD-(D/E)XK nuclease family protein, partial [Oscillospiraceae bacterium]|nr:PD-(D/E)XK nuclease family protein [Oscillospiraceae bacterium]
EGLEEGAEVFELPRRTALRLIRTAKELGTDCDVSVERYVPGKRTPEMEFAERHLFEYSPARFENENTGVRLYTALNIVSECELAAANVLRLVSENNCRFGDIAIAARGFGEYAAVLESIFEYYGVPLYTAKRSDILKKPVPALIGSAYEIIFGGWDTDDVLQYIKTGLTGLSQKQSDLLARYAAARLLRGGSWTKEDDLRLHPDGYGEEFDEDAENRLKEINECRRVIKAPLIRLQEASSKASTAREQAEALCRFFADISLPERLAERASGLKASGSREIADEYAQLWDITKNALEQFAAVLNDAPLTREEFSKLFLILLSCYDVGTIPVSLDRVQAGEPDRMRKRNIKHLLVLGASDDRMPLIAEKTGILSPEEKEEIARLGSEIGDRPSDEICREFGLIYNCLTLPSESLTVSYSQCGAEGALTRPSFVFGRLKLLFGEEERAFDPADVRTRAKGPALELAAAAVAGEPALSGQAALEYFKNKVGFEENLKLISLASEMSRGRISESAANALYGKKPSLSAGRAETLASCKFKYFLQYGLKAKPEREVVFDKRETGNFMHYVLEHTASEIAETGGFRNADKEKVTALTDKYVSLYIHEKLEDFREKSGRFEYLFRRLTGAVRRVVADMAEELKESDFMPLDFELDFSAGGKLPPVSFDGEDAPRLTGKVDRVDGWLHDDKLYIRVVDYKTGKKSFDLSDVRYGLNMQMLLYLFSIEKTGSRRYGREIVPAGVLYVPARDAFIQTAGRNAKEDDLEKKRARDLKRSGLILSEPEVIAAMETSGEPRFIPVSFNKSGEAVGDSLVTYERLGMLGRHTEAILRKLSEELKSGSIDADPYFKDRNESACLYCDYSGACRFDESKDKPRFLAKQRPDEVWEYIEESCK